MREDIFLSKPSTSLTFEQIKLLLRSGRKVAVTLEPEELKVVPNVRKVEELTFNLWSEFEFDHDLPAVIKIKIQARVEIIDDHSFDLIPLVLSDDEDVILSSSDESEIVEHSGHEVDLRPTLLAVFYSMIPNSYSRLPLTKLELEDCTIYSEEEYGKIKKNNPFGQLKWPDENN